MGCGNRVHPSVLVTYTSCYRSLITVLTKILNVDSDYPYAGTSYNVSNDTRCGTAFHLETHSGGTGEGWYPRSGRVCPIGSVPDARCQMIELLGGVGLWVWERYQSLIRLEGMSPRTPVAFGRAAGCVKGGWVRGCLLQSNV